jgi:hypothetical protein
VWGLLDGDTKKSCISCVCNLGHLILDAAMQENLFAIYLQLTSNISSTQPPRNIHGSNLQ